MCVTPSAPNCLQMFVPASLAVRGQCICWDLSNAWIIGRINPQELADLGYLVGDMFKMLKSGRGCKSERKFSRDLGRSLVLGGMGLRADLILNPSRASLNTCAFLCLQLVLQSRIKRQQGCFDREGHPWGDRPCLAPAKFGWVAWVTCGPHHCFGDPGEGTASRLGVSCELRGPKNPGRAGVVRGSNRNKGFPSEDT